MAAVISNFLINNVVPISMGLHINACYSTFLVAPACDLHNFKRKTYPSFAKNFQNNLSTRVLVSLALPLSLIGIKKISPRFFPYLPNIVKNCWSLFLRKYSLPLVLTYVTIVSVLALVISNYYFLLHPECFSNP